MEYPMGFALVVAFTFFVMALYFSFVAGKLRGEAKLSKQENKILSSLVNFDPLTGILNRGAVQNALDRLIGPFPSTECVKRRTDDGTETSLNLALLFLDIDYFKKVNDVHGHQTGDDVLQEVAAAIGKVLRTTDVLGRWGGEEFIVILPETSDQGALETAEKIRKAVSEINFTVEGELIPTTISIGVACADEWQPWKNLVGAADAALYQAKSRGRDQVVLRKKDNSYVPGSIRLVSSQ